MPESETGAENSPDVETVRRLVKLMHRYGLTALDWKDGGTSLRLRRGGGTHAAVEPSSIAPAPLPVIPAPAAPAPASAPKPVAEGIFIRSPMVGTFYESPSPDAKPYILIGSTVRADTTVCLIEAMKVFTEINAGVSGTIVEVLAKSGQPVEFDQPLFRVEPT